MRPKKTRWVLCEPGERCFRPQGKPPKKLDGVTVTLDEFEAVRLADLERLTQEEVSKKIGVHRSTISRILDSARYKIANALVNAKAIHIEGGCCVIRNRKRGTNKK